MSSTSEETKAVVQNLYAASTAGDRPTVLSYIDENITVSPPPYTPWAGPHTSRQLWHENAVPFLQQVHDNSTMEVELIVAGDKCVCVINIGLKDSDEKLEYAEVWQVDNGKCVKMDVYLRDPRPLLRQIEKLGLGDKGKGVHLANLD